MTIFRDSNNHVVHTHSWMWQGPDDVIWNVEYTIESYGCPSNGWDEPGEAAEICIWEVQRDSDEYTINLATMQGEEAEMVERFENRIREMIEQEIPEDNYDE